MSYGIILNILVIDKISDILKPERQIKYKELNHYDATVKGMIEDVTDYEEEIREGFQDIVNNCTEMKAISKDIKNLIRKRIHCHDTK
jgi:type I restriction-modification system DNA methylase subunit